MKQLKRSEIKHIREILARKTDNKCPISGLDISNGDACCDHAHEDSLHPCSETIEGQVRGVLHKFANVLEGQMRGKFKRSGLAAHMNFEDFLFNLYTYLMDFREPMLHPLAKDNKPKKLMKSSYNTLIREINSCNKFRHKPEKYPAYPKSKKMTKRLQELFVKYEITPKFYGSK